LQIESSLEEDHPDAEIGGCCYCLGWDAASPKSKVIVPKYFETIPLEPVAK